MAPPDQREFPIAVQAPGRCHSCLHQRAYDMPHRTVFWCNRFREEMDEEQRSAVRHCPEWKPFRPIDTMGRCSRLRSNPLCAQVIEAEDRVFYTLKRHLDRMGMDLKTILLLSQPSLRDASSVSWVDELDLRFGDSEEELPSFEETVATLRALRYDSICAVLRPLQMKIAESANDR